jgi:hypothetical protein
MLFGLTLTSNVFCRSLVVAMSVLAALESRGQESSDAASPDATGDEAPWFEEVHESAGIDFQHVSGHRGEFYLPEIVGGGVGLLDYDGDGLLDIYLVQSGSLHSSATPNVDNRLYRNKGDGTFANVTAAAKAAGSGYGMGCACGDYDGDGDTDLYVTNVGVNALLQNKGDGTFANVAKAAGVADPRWSTSASFLDYDADGHLDLVVVNYVNWSRTGESECIVRGRPEYCHPSNYSPAPDTLYRNRGDGTFEDVSRKAKLNHAYGNGLGVSCADFNGDGRTDIYVANDGTLNQLWMNAGDGTFVDESLIAGCALNIEGVAEAGMGVAAFDLENDGDLDLFVAHLRGETNTLYLNDGGDFEDVTAPRGLGAPSLPFTGFGLGCADFNHDGYLDAFVANGRVMRGRGDDASQDPYAEPNQLFRGAKGGFFTELAPRGGVSKDLVSTSRGAAFGDIDNDGDVDIVVANRDARPHVLRNTVGSRGNWLQLSVVDERGRVDIGARVRVVTGARWQWRSVQPGFSYCSSNDARVHCGLGTATRVDAVEVHWSRGGKESFGPFEAGHLHALRKGAGRR